jgi:hypothetical protein
MKELGRLLEEAGHYGVSAWTDKALDLHDYQHHGPDPDAVLSKYVTRGEATADVLLLTQELLRRVEALEGRARQTEELEKALEEARRALARWTS